MTPEQKAEKIRQLVWNYINEHGLITITDDGLKTDFKSDIIKIIQS